jgi:hypothetical protein
LIAATFAMNFLSSPAPRPLLPPSLPGQPPQVNGKIYAYLKAESANPLARKLLRTGQFMTPPVENRPVTPTQLLLESAHRLSDSLSEATDMYLQEPKIAENRNGDEIKSLLLRFNTVIEYSLYTSRARYDKARKGLLGRLLNDLSRAAAPLVPMFTPATYVESNFDECRDEDVTFSAVMKAYPDRSRAEYEEIIERMSRRDMAKLAAKQGARTYLNFCEVGATLGMKDVFLPEHQVASAVRDLPADLRAGAEKAIRLTERIRSLHPTAQDQKLECENQLMDCNWGHLVFPAFMVIANETTEGDPLTEYLSEEWQMASDYGNTWPQMTFRLMSASDYLRAARLLNHTCQALPLVRDALLALGAELC